MNHTRDTLHWESYDGRKILIKDLEVRHLVNILNHIAEANANAALDGVEAYSDWIVQLLVSEAELRVMAGWAENIGIPRLNEDGTWGLINQTPQERAIEDAKTALHIREMAKPKNQRLSKSELYTELHKIQRLTAPEMCEKT
jgi:hypothetical protein